MKGKCDGFILLRIRRGVYELSGRYVKYKFNDFNLTV